MDSVLEKLAHLRYQLQSSAGREHVGACRIKQDRIDQEPLLPPSGPVTWEQVYDWLNTQSDILFGYAEDVHNLTKQILKENANA